MGSTDTLAGNLGVKGVFTGEEPLTRETRAFVRRGDVEGRSRAVTANGDDHRDPQGRWLSRVTIERPKGRRVADLRIVAPYTSLKAAPGRDELADKVRGLRNG